MSWQYFLVFLGSFLVDVMPFPLPPAFVVMIFLQIFFGLNLWWVIGIGVAGSILGRYVLTLYIPKLSDSLFKPDKNEDVRYLGKVLKEKGWKSQLLILVYTMMPLPSTPLFIAGGMARMKPYYIIPMFVVGKITSDMLAVLLGKYAAQNTEYLLEGLVSWQSITGLIVGLLLIFFLLFIDWRSLLQQKRFKLMFKIWK